MEEEEASGTGWANGFPLAIGGMARPSRGVREALPVRLPGIGGRRRGAGADMMSIVRKEGGGETAEVIPAYCSAVAALYRRGICTRKLVCSGDHGW